MKQDTDNKILKYLHKQGFIISTQDLGETRLDRNNSKITIVVR